MVILGLSFFYHDSAVCLVEDGEIIFAAEEERFSRKKHDAEFPKLALQAALDFCHLEKKDISIVAFYDKPILKFDRLLETYLSDVPRGFSTFIKAMPIWLKDKLWIKKLIREHVGDHVEILFTEHHESHAASCFFASPFKNAAFLTVDGVGEWATTSYGIGKENKITMLAEQKFPHSLGLLYSAFTYYTGFKVNSGEYKVMGLAPYGEPRFVQKIYDNLIDVKEDGSFRLNTEYFNFVTGLEMTNEKFHDLFGKPPRKSESKLDQRTMDLARSIQVVTDEIMLKMTRHIHKVTKQKNLTMAGGVALNCVANRKILNEGPFEKIWIQPAAGDAGGALGAALFTWYQYLGNKRTIVSEHGNQKGSLLGPSFTPGEIESYLRRMNVKYELLETSEMIDAAVQAINNQKVVGWFQGRMEFGPRALGCRSILGDARSPKMQTVMNVKIKQREEFRPFAPSVLGEKASQYFDIKVDSPYMLLIADVKEKHRRKLSEKEKQLKGLAKLPIKRSSVPAITHVDYSARLQTVHKELNPLYHELISRFDKKYGCPVIINTSFNIRGEPIVCTPQDAYECFMGTDMDVLVMGNYIMRKEDQASSESIKKKRKKIIALD